MNDLEKAMIYHYNLYLLNDEKMPVYFFKKERAEETVKIILKYCVEQLLRWSPYEMYDNFNLTVIARLKLENIVKYIDFPLEYDQDKDFYYYAIILYPDIIRVSRDDAVIRHFEQVLSGKKKKLKKGFLEGEEGKERIKICFRYIIEKEGFYSVAHIYQTFAGKKGRSMLIKYGLENARKNHYETIIDMVYDSLGSTKDNEDYYHYYRFFKFKVEDMLK